MEALFWSNNIIIIVSNKVLNEFFVPYGSSLETNILLASVSSILITFWFW